MNQGKLDMVKQEMTRLNIDILGTSELKWTGMGEFNSDDHQVYYCRQESLRRNGVAFIVNKRVGKAVLGYNLQNDRMISVRIQGKPFSITVVQVYASTTGAEEAEVDRSYEGLQHLLESTPKNDVLIIMGDWNAKVGSQKITGITGKFGLGLQNEAGHRLVEFCQETTMVIANALFQQPKRRRYTWTSHRNQIDYVLCSQRWRSSIQSVKTRPGADCGSDHELPVAKFRLKLKKVGKSTRPIRYNLNHIPDEYTVEEKKCKKAKRLSEEALQIAEERREAKGNGERERYKQLNAEFQRIARRDKNAFLNEQCKEIEENSRIGRTRDLFKEIGDMKGTFHAKMGMIKDQNDRDLTEAEEIKKRWQDYTEELCKKDLNVPDDHDGVVTDLEPDILECEVEWALGSLSNNKTSGGDSIPAELFKILKDNAIKCYTQYGSKFRKLNSGHRIGKVKQVWVWYGFGGETIGEPHVATLRSTMEEKWDINAIKAENAMKGYFTNMDWEKGEGHAFPYFVFGAACSEVEIDCLTGDHKNIRTDIVMDACFSINPAIDIGQIEGGFMQGLGLYTMEKIKFSPEEQQYTLGPVTYKIPAVCDVPEQFRIYLLLNSRNPVALYSSKVNK
ncbi:Craniofacial development protein 2 [Varanus komodoensis]|nr:Craniofacial development protein 2 [Varanus komodoensis]